MKVISIRQPWAWLIVRPALARHPDREGGSHGAMVELNKALGQAEGDLL